MVNRGEEKVRVHMNVVPRSTGNTNSVTELILCSTICVPSATRHNIHKISAASFDPGGTFVVEVTYLMFYSIVI